MKCHDHIDGVPDSWVAEFPAGPFTDAEGRDEWFRLNDVIYNHPAAALRLFERFAGERDSTGSPDEPSTAALRTFLTVHGDGHRNALAALSRRSPTFAKIYRAVGRSPEARPFNSRRGGQGQRRCN